VPPAVELKVNMHPDCVVNIALQPNTTTSGSEFAVTGVAVVPYSNALSVNPVDSWDMAVVRATGTQLPNAWP
jgi:hypothetical protein